MIYPDRGATQSFVDEAITSETDECILWPFSLSSGYATVTRQGQTQRVTHLVLEATVGPMPESGMHACHAPVICHNRACINPRHLRWGTPKENAADTILDGTSTRGESNGRNKLTDEQVQVIYADQRTYRTIASDYGIHWVTVGAIKRGILWQWLTGHIQSKPIKRPTFEVIPLRPDLKDYLRTTWASECGERVRLRRFELRLTMDSVAKAAQTTQATISRIELGGGASDRMKVSLAMALDCEPATLFPWPPMKDLVAA